MLKAVLFDLDGVITDTAKYHYSAWERCAKRLDFTIDESFNTSLKGVDRTQSLHLLLEHGNISLSHEEFQKTLETKNNDYLELIKNMKEEDILPGIKILLTQLKDANIKCILCSASKNAPLILQRLHLQNDFQAIVDPSSLRHGKPAPDIFLSGAKLAGVEVSECVGVEDAKAGIEAIKAAHMKAIGIGSDLCTTQADVVIDTTKQLTMTLIQNTLLG